MHFRRLHGLCCDRRCRAPVPPLGCSCGRTCLWVPTPAFSASSRSLLRPTVPCHVPCEASLVCTCQHGDVPYSPERDFKLLPWLSGVTHKIWALYVYKVEHRCSYRSSHDGHFREEGHAVWGYHARKPRAPTQRPCHAPRTQSSELLGPWLQPTCTEPHVDDAEGLPVHVPAACLNAGSSQPLEFLGCGFNRGQNLMGAWAPPLHFSAQPH